MTKETLYYDGSCPLCRREITHLEKISDCHIDFIDVHDRGMSGRKMSTQEIAARLRVLHLETASGTVLKGLDANVAAWQHTRWGFLFRPLRWPLIRQVADRLYGYWADRRFDRLYPDGYKRPDTIDRRQA